MKTKNQTKKALLMSAMSLLLCFSMLIGTTFAWFTDEVSTKNNIIKSGNLDVELYYQNDEVTDWKKVDANTNIFKETLWEPGHTEVIYFKVVNEGSLALKYQLGVNIVKETSSVNIEGNKFKLSDYIYFDIIDGLNGETNAFADRKAAMKYATEKDLISKGYSKRNTLESGNEEYVAMIVYMPETIGNAANYGKNQAVPSIELGIDLFATQITYEEDSFGDDYDSDALACDVIATPETIDSILADEQWAGKVIGLADGQYGDLKIAYNNTTLVSNTAVVDFIDLNGKNGITIDGLTFNAAGAKSTYTYSPAQAGAYVTNIADAGNAAAAAYGAGDIKILNCTFTGSPADASIYAPIDFEGRNFSSTSKNITISNCVFECNAMNYVRLNYVGGGYVAIFDNIFGGLEYSTSHNTINASSNGASWTITGNTFYNWNVDKAAFGSSRSTIDGVLTLTIKDNSFVNVGADNIAVLNIKTETTSKPGTNYIPGNFVLNYSDNTANYGTYTFETVAVQPDAAENDNYYYMKKADDVGQLVAPGLWLTATNTYAITSPEGLVNLRTAIVDNSGEVYRTVNLMTDLDMTGVEYVPMSKMFLYFNGNNHTISNLTVTGSDWAGRSGLFAYLGGGYIKDLTLENVTSTGSQAGAFIGHSEAGRLINCTLAGNNVVTWSGATADTVGDGIGAFVGVTIEPVEFTGAIADGATVILVKNGMTADGNVSRTSKTNTYVGGLCDGCTPTVNITNNGTVKTGIASAADLALIANSGNFILLNDIDMKDIVWTPVTTKAANGSLTIDGNGYAIKNFNVNGDRAALIGYSATTTVIKNLTIADSTFTGTNGDGENAAAAFVAWATEGYSVTIDKCIVDNCNIKDAKYVGGVLGYKGGHAALSITNCEVKNSTTLTTTYNESGTYKGHLGGIVGFINNTNADVEVDKCAVTNVTFVNENNSQRVGIYAGTNHGVITNCTNTGVVGVTAKQGTASGGTVN